MVHTPVSAAAAAARLFSSFLAAFEGEAGGAEAGLACRGKVEGRRRCIRRPPTTGRRSPPGLGSGASRLGSWVSWSGSGVSGSGLGLGPSGPLPSGPSPSGSSPSGPWASGPWAWDPSLS
eukprot:1335936-Pyramimonas_sp.AAC.1